METHIMKLYPSSFEMIKKGKKIIEMRLFDEKRQKLKIGDFIIFVNTESNKELKVEIQDLHFCVSFKELYDKFDKEKLGYKEEEIANPDDMLAYYSQENIDKYGVLGIEIAIFDLEFQYQRNKQRRLDNTISLFENIANEKMIDKEKEDFLANLPKKETYDYNLNLSSNFISFTDSMLKKANTVNQLLLENIYTAKKEAIDDSLNNVLYDKNNEFGKIELDALLLNPELKSYRFYQYITNLPYNLIVELINYKVLLTINIENNTYLFSKNKEHIIFEKNENTIMCSGTYALYYFMKDINLEDTLDELQMIMKNNLYHPFILKRYEFISQFLSNKLIFNNFFIKEVLVIPFTLKTITNPEIHSINLLYLDLVKKNKRIIFQKEKNAPNIIKIHEFIVIQKDLDKLFDFFLMNNISFKN